jgi:AcrR family transcriptional regulator
MNPREKRKEKTRQQIIKTTAQMVRRDGVEKLSLRQVAKKMNYSPSGMYEYFPNKEALLAAVNEKGLKSLSKYINRVSSELTWKEILIERGLAYLDFAFTESEMYQLVFSKLHSQRRSINDSVNINSPYFYFFDAIQKGVEAGEFHLHPEHSTDTVAFAFWAILHGMAMLELTHLKGFEADFDKFHRINLEKMIPGFLAAD